MKTRRLSEIDLARFAALQPGQQLEGALRGYNAGGGAWSYNPVRESTPDILCTDTPLLGPSAPVSWPRVSAQIARACRRGTEQVRANVEVGKVLFESARAKGWKAAGFPMGRMPIGIGETLRYWSDVVLDDGAGLVVPFFDHRRDNGLNTLGSRQIVFSIQNIWIRDRHPDLAEARLAVIRFPVQSDARQFLISYHTEGDLLSFAELDARVRGVYETWAQVSAEKLREPKPSKTGTGDLF